jgi:hypothetical protein
MTAKIKAQSIQNALSKLGIATRPKRVPKTLYLTEENLVALKRLCGKKGQPTMSELVDKLIEKFVRDAR